MSYVPPLCAICLGPMLPGNEISTLQCNHEYHRACLQPWLDTSNTCPYDRRVIRSISHSIVREPPSRWQIFLKNAYHKSTTALRRLGATIQEDPQRRQLARKVASTTFSILGRHLKNIE